MAEITGKNFVEEFKAAFKRNPSDYVMMRSDRVTDPQEGRYRTDAERETGDRAMRLWFEYLFDKKLNKTIKVWVSVLRAGKPLMAVCPDPAQFDLSWLPPRYPATPPRFFDKMLSEREQSPIDRAAISSAFKLLVKELQFGSEACTPKTCPRQYGQECPREDKAHCRSSDEYVSKGRLISREQFP